MSRFKSDITRLISTDRIRTLLFKRKCESCNPMSAQSCAFAYPLELTILPMNCSYSGDEPHERSRERGRSDDAVSPARTVCGSPDLLTNHVRVDS